MPRRLDLNGLVPKQGHGSNININSIYTCASGFMSQTLQRPCRPLCSLRKRRGTVLLRVGPQSKFLDPIRTGLSKKSTVVGPTPVLHNIHDDFLLRLTLLVCCSICSSLLARCVSMRG